MYFKRGKNKIIKKCMGQATLEFVMVIPFVIIVILAASQAGLFVYNKIILQQASRECARIISTTDNNARAKEAVRRIAGESINIDIEPEDPTKRGMGDMVTVMISKQPGGILKTVRELTGKEFNIKARTCMRMECD